MTETSISVFFAYSRKDEVLRASLEVHLSNLQGEGITTWHDGEIDAGTTWDDEIKSRLESADIILLLISPDFLASLYCRDIEIPLAMKRHENKEACVIPVILRPCDWGNSPFSKLQAYPKDAKPVTSWKNRDEAFVSITQGIREAAKQQHDCRIQKAQEKEKEFKRNKYREEAEKILSDGDLTIAKRDSLDELWHGLDLTIDEAEQIEDEIHRRHKEYDENLRRYQNTLIKYVRKGQYPFDEDTRKDLQKRQEFLGLKARDVEYIENLILQGAIAVVQGIESESAQETRETRPGKPPRHPFNVFREFLARVEFKKEYFLLFLIPLVGFGWFIPPASSLKSFVRDKFDNTSLTPEDVKRLQKQISAGERILAPTEAETAKKIAEASNSIDPTAFGNAKKKGVDEISKGNYSGAFDSLSRTRQSDRPEFYQNAPETLIYINNAKIGNDLAYIIAVASPISQSDSYGLSVLRGAALAQQKINDTGGIRDANGNKAFLKIVLVDDQNRPNISLAQFVSNLGIDPSLGNPELRILGLVGHQTSDLTSQLGKIYSEAGLPIISPSATSTENFGKFDSVFLAPPSTYQMSERLAQEISRERVIVFYDSQEDFSSSFGSETCEVVRASCELWDFHQRPSVNSETVVEEISNGSTALVIAFNPNKSEDNKARASEIIEAVSDYNEDSEDEMELFSGNAFYDEGLINKARDSGVSVVRVGPWDRSLSGNLPTTLVENNDKFLAENKDLWGTDQVNWFTLMAYNASMAMAKAIEESELPPPTSISELRNLRRKISMSFTSGELSVNGALGEIHFSEEGYVDRGNIICLLRVGSSTNNQSDCQPSESFQVN